MRFKKSIICLIFLIILPSIIATYPELGGETGDYRTGEGQFDLNVVSTTTGSETAVGRIPPLVEDLDGDGVNEIILLDDNTFVLFQNRTLDFLDSVFIESMTAGTNTSNVLLFDIDDDTYKEIIVATETTGGQIEIFEWNGTDLWREIGINYTFTAHESQANRLLACKGSNDCVMFSTRKGTMSGGMSETLFANHFESTNITGVVSIDSFASTNKFCFPNIKDITVTDYDGDGKQEYIFSGVNAKFDVNQDELYIYYIEDDPAGTFTVDLEILVNDDIVIEDTEAPGGTTCQEVSQFNHFTPPLVFDAGNRPGLETIIAVQKDPDEFRMLVYDASGALQEEYPKGLLGIVTDADGELISNVVRADVYSETGDKDFCVIGFENTDDKIDLSCGSLQRSQLVPSFDFFIDHEGIFDLTNEFNRYNNMIHEGQHSDTPCFQLGDGGDCESNLYNPSEFITTFGVFTPIENTCNSVGNCDMVQIFTPPPTMVDYAVIPADVEQNGLSDFLFLTSSQLFYLDDAFVNSAPDLDLINANPCGFEATVQVNETVKIFVTGSDVDEDQVQYRVIFYDGHPTNEQDTNWSSLVPSGVQEDFTLNANLTGSVDVTIMIRDSEGNVGDSYQRDFDVGQSGFVFGEFDCSIDLEAQRTAEEEAISAVDTTVDQSDNPIRNAILDIPGADSLGATVIWLIIMVIVGVVMFIESHSAHPHATVGVILMFQFLMLILGILLGFIGIGFLVTIIVVGGIVIGLWLGPRFVGAGRGG